ncbi:MAG: hypothetical protein ACD_73C00088G0003 [uncultured bacterium]|nr:MAG: hypothetical protein ACD_73C00088G0003 [uncultured bacterium]
MGEWKYLWWELPKTTDEIHDYIEKKFQYAGDHVWMKLLKSSLEKRLDPAFINDDKINHEHPKRG